MCYEAAPATALVATSCALCGRPLVDAASVETGVGPVCREKYGYDAPEAELSVGAVTLALLDTPVAFDASASPRELANALVYRIAAEPASKHVAAYARAISALGYRTLGAKIAERLGGSDFAAKRSVAISRDGETLVVSAPYSPTFGEALRAAVRGRRWDGDRKVWLIPASARAGLWAALREAFSGFGLISPDGAVSVIP